MGIICPSGPTTLNVSRVATNRVHAHLVLAQASLKFGILLALIGVPNHKVTIGPRFSWAARLSTVLLLGSSGTTDQNLMNVSLPNLKNTNPNFL